MAAGGMTEEFLVLFSTPAATHPARLQILRDSGKSQIGHSSISDRNEDEDPGRRLPAGCMRCGEALLHVCKTSMKY
jgi:hypothetical protein